MIDATDAIGAAPAERDPAFKLECADRARLARRHDRAGV